MSDLSLKVLADCCIGTAEAEVGAGFLDQIFVETGILEQIIDMIPGSPKILVGNKGTGKSIIFRKLEKIFTEKKVLVVYLTPSDIVHEDPQSETPAVLQSFYYDCLVRHIAITLGKNINGLVGEDNAKLIHEAIISGEKDPDTIQKIIPLLSGIGTLLTSRDFSNLQLQQYSPSTNKLSEIIGRNLSNQKVFYLIIDEPDDVRLDGQGAGRIWALLHACRKFTQQVQNIRCLISLRSEIWHLLCEDPTGRKNIDQFSPLITSLNPSEDEIKRIIYKRLEFAFNKNNDFKYINHNDKSSFYHYFFEGTATKLPPPATVETSTWEDYISKQSRGRPRDSIQLIRRLALQAINNKKELISQEEVTQCAIAFSESCINSLCAEYESDFKDANRILTGFSTLQFENSANSVKEYLRKRISEYNPTIRGKRLQTSPDGIFILWRILHEMGFLNPRIPDKSKSLGYRHILYNENPNFVAQNNFNEMTKVCWEIHPVYRSYLYSKIDQEVHRKAMVQEYKKNSKIPCDPAFARIERKVKRNK